MREGPGGTGRGASHAVGRTVFDLRMPPATRRPRGMPPAHECSGDRHYPCGSGFANKEERRRENAVRAGFAAAPADKHPQWPALANATGRKRPRSHLNP